jgi:predicted DNA-binding transcriptional regulator YafY
MRADRLLSLLMILQTRGLTSAADLARELEVSERTIYRDVTALNTAGVPIYAETGRGGGFALVESYRTSLTGLSRDEIQALYMLAIPQPLVDLGFSQNLKAALLKLQASLPERYQQQETHIRQRLHLDPASWELDSGALPALAAVQQAVWQDQRLFVRHAIPSGVVTEVTIEPYGLVAKAGTWYLVYAHRSNFHARRVSDLLEALPTGETFERQLDFDLQAFWQAWCAERLRSRSSFTVTVRAEVSVARRLKAFIGVARRVESASPPDEHGRIVLTLSFNHFDMARDRLLALGRAVEVLDPPELRLAILDYAEQIASLYHSPALRF